MEFLRTYGEREVVLHAVGAHHYEIEPNSSEAVVVIIADTISAARPGARRENLENYIKRLSSLEGLANSFPGVERSYAVQAGREIRLIVKPSEIDDLGAARLANEVARAIERELEYPGQIKVTVIRETRAQQTAK
jgi:ribonuclease Y